VVILDSLQKIISKEATDESSAKGLMHFLSTLKARYGCSIVVVHHNRKRPNEGKVKHVVSLSDVFGSVFLTAEPDFVVNIDKRGKGEVDIKMLKNRYGPDDHHFVATRDANLQLHDELRDLKENFDDDEPVGRFGL
jgi:RecA-family ATPase